MEKTIKSVESKIDLSAKEKKPEFNSGKFVTLNKYFQVDKGLYAVLKRNIAKSANTLLLGPTGVGKTELVANIASSLGLPLTIFDMGTMTDPIMSLVGNHIISMTDGHTTSVFVKSRFSEVIQRPGVILLDELSRASAQANNLLFPCLDFRRELPMEYCFEDTAPIKVHPQCVFIATANLGSQYTGTHKLDRALQDRFMCIQVDQLNTVQTTNVIKMHTPSIGNATIAEMVRVYAKLNEMHDSFTISFSLSIRHLKMIAELVVDGFTLYDAFYIVCKGIGGTEGSDATLKPIFDKSTTPEVQPEVKTSDDWDDEEEEEDED
jgi:nitric oxide reductase NorQ protein